MRVSKARFVYDMKSLHFVNIPKFSRSIIRESNKKTTLRQDFDSSQQKIKTLYLIVIYELTYLLIVSGHEYEL